MLVKSSRHLFHSVSYIFHRFNQAAACSQLLTKCLHVDIYGSVFLAVGTIPNSLVQPLAYKNLTGMIHKNLQQLKLFIRKLDGFLIDLYQTFLQGKAYPTGLIDILNGCPLYPSEDRLDSGYHFHQAKGISQTVIRTGAQSANHIQFIGALRLHNNRNYTCYAGLANPFEQRKVIYPR